jgi:beta-lactamase class D
VSFTGGFSLEARRKRGWKSQKGKKNSWIVVRSESNTKSFLFAHLLSGDG